MPAMRELNWRVLAVAVAFQALSFGTSVYTFTFFVIPWQDSFGVSRSTIMQVSLLLSLAAGLSGPIVARLLVVYSLRLVVGLGMLLCATAAIVASAASSFLVVGLAYGILFGAGLSLAGPISAQVVVMRSVPPDRRGLAFGFVLTGTSFGGIIFAPIIGYGIASFGWRPTLASIVPLATLVVLPFVLALLPNTPGSSDPSAPDVHKARPVDFFAKARFWVALAAAVPALFCFTAVQYHLAPFAESLDVSVALTSTSVSLMAAAMIASKVIVGHLADRTDSRLLAGAFLGLSAVSLALLASEPTGELFAIACLILGFASGSYLPLIASYYADSYGPEMFPRAMGYATPILALSGLGGAFAGWAIEAMDGYPVVFALLTTVILLSMAMSAVLSIMATRREIQVGP